MRNHQKRETQAAKEFLEPQDAFQIEMVRRFVEQQQLGFLNNLGQDGEALAPAARQAGDELAGLREPGFGEAGVGAGLAFVVGEAFVLQGAQELLSHAPVVARVLGPVLLGEEGDFEPFAADDFSFVGLLGLREYAKEGGLAGAVGADEAGLLAFKKAEREVLE